MNDSNLKDEMKKTCNMQIKFWNNLMNYIDSVDESDETNMYEIWHKYFQENTEASLQFVKTNLLCQKTEEAEGVEWSD